MVKAELASIGMLWLLNGLDHGATTDINKLTCHGNSSFQVRVENTGYCPKAVFRFTNSCSWNDIQNVSNAAMSFPSVMQQLWCLSDRGIVGI
jgi:hypothetical protein